MLRGGRTGVCRRPIPGFASVSVFESRLLPLSHIFWLGAWAGCCGADSGGAGRPSVAGDGGVEIEVYFSVDILVWRTVVLTP